MAIQGLRTTANFQADQRPKNWREAILLLRPNGMAPLTALTSQMREASTDDPEFSWFEKNMPNQRLQMSADLTAGATTIAVVSGALQLKKNHVLRVEATDEIMFVAADPTTDTSVTVVRGYAGSVAAAVTVATSNPFFHVIGTAHEEASMPPVGINYDPTKRRNFTQIFRNTLEMSRTAQKTRLRTGDAIREAKRETLELHSVEIEKALWFGRASETTLNGKPIRTTAGVLNFIDPANVIVNTGGTFDMATFMRWLEQIFRYGSSEKIAFTGNAALLAMNEMVRLNSVLQIQSGIKEYGMAVTRFTSPFGELVIKTHPLFNQLTSGTGYNAVDTWMAVFDMENIRYRYLTGDDMRYESDLQPNGLDGMQAGYITECGLEVNHPMSHFLIKGLRTGTRDAA